jgi:hypothetical protein
MRFGSCLWLPLYFLITATVSAAPISVTTGAPNGSSDGTSEWYLMADDFWFPADTILTHMAAPGQVDGTWLIFDGDGASSPGTLLAYGAIAPLDAEGRFPVTHLLLTGDTHYWYGYYGGRLDECPLVAGGGSSFWGTDTNGSAIALVATHTQRRCTDDVLGGWLEAFHPGSSYWSREHLHASFTDLSFTAYGESVPEPASLLLMTVGGGALLRRWRASRRL